MNRSLRIAVADDEADIREYFAKILPRMGHQVLVAASNGRELYEQCLILKPDLVITDLKMPELDGLEVVEKLSREQPVPVILVSAYHDALSTDRAEMDHIVGYLVKPIKQVDLEPMIALALLRLKEKKG